MYVLVMFVYYLGSCLSQDFSWLGVWGFCISVHCDIFLSNEIYWPFQFVQKINKSLFINDTSSLSFN
jgi:phosphatidylserine decarboxylase